MLGLLRTVVVAGLLALAAGAAAQPASLGGVPVAGYAAARIDPDGRVHAFAEGAAELAPDGRIVRPLAPETPMRVASISKVIVALAILRLADAGRLSLDDPASLHLGWPLVHPLHPDAPVTIRLLLRHESSLSDAGGYGMRLGDRLPDALPAAMWSKARPGTRFDYANLNSVILATIVEKRTAMRFDEAAQTLVLRPLGIAGCFNWSLCPAGFADAGAILYRKSADFGGSWAPDGPWVPQVDAQRPAAGCPVRLADGQTCDLAAIVPGTNGGLFAPQGGLRISVVELAWLGAALLDREAGFLKPATWDLLFEAVPVQPGGDGSETDTRLMQVWSVGGLHCFSGSGEAGGDQPLAPRPMAGCGHLGEAYGLFSGLVIDPSARTVAAWALTGTADRPAPGAFSRFNRLEELLIARTLSAGMVTD
ncbi:MAG: serine hydrolase domain-containing protein [Sphingomonadaceae bacterium]